MGQRGPDVRFKVHTANSRRLPDKLSELCLRSREDAKDIEALVDLALARLEGTLRLTPAKVKPLDERRRSQRGA